MQEQCDICTFRNNLNKIFGTPLELQSSWTVDACRVGPIMYLDIHQLPQTTYPDADLFQYYGYKYAFSNGPLHHIHMLHARDTGHTLQLTHTMLLSQISLVQAGDCNIVHCNPALAILFV